MDETPVESEKWGDRIPHIERGAVATSARFVDGKPVELAGCRARRAARCPIVRTSRSAGRHARRTYKPANN